jgi:ferredoxin
VIKCLKIYALQIFILKNKKLTGDHMKAEIIYFSATGTTRKIVKAISKGLDCTTHFTDITLLAKRTRYLPTDSDIVLIAVPIYGERIPQFIYDFLSQIEGGGRPLIAVSVYGNIGFGVSLNQFEAYALDHDFQLIAAGAFIGQHTYASEKTPIAYGRPDEADLGQAFEFGRKIRTKIDADDLTLADIPKSTLPKFITRLPDSLTRFLIRRPVIIKPVCNACQTCFNSCPMEAIDSSSLIIDEKKCIRCYACIKACAKSARIAKFRLQLFEIIFRHIGRKRKENKTFI